MLVALRRYGRLLQTASADGIAFLSFWESPHGCISCEGALLGGSGGAAESQKSLVTATYAVATEMKYD